MRILMLIPAGFIDKKFLGRPMRFWIPVAIVAILIAGLFSPLFDLSSIHGVGSVKLYAQHYYFDFIAGLGGYWAATFCKHTWHRIGLFLTIDALCTLALVTLVG
jgi:hypothetical protein